ncbi:MAG: hypothetical protein WCR36_04625 [Bacteroidaceae bacterium]
MEVLSYLFKILWKIKWWLILLPLFVGIMVITNAKGKNGGYTVHTTLFTGIEGGFTLEEGINKRIQQNNTIDLLGAKSTFRRVSYHLFSRVMVFGDPNEDNDICNAASYNEIYRRMSAHKTLVELVKKYRAKKDENGLYQAILAYEKPDKKNFVYGLFNYFHPQYSYDALQNIDIQHLEGSDIVEIAYTNDDPGIAYNTLNILIEEFNHEYRDMRYGETTKVISFYKDLLEQTGKELRESEDQMTNYREDNRIINYDEESKALTGIDASYKQKYLLANIDYETAEDLVSEIENKLGDYINRYKKNQQFIELLNESNQLSSKIGSLEALKSTEKLENDFLNKDTAKIVTESNLINSYKEKLAKVDAEMHNTIGNINSKYTTKEGFSKETLTETWLTNLLKLREARITKAAIENSMDGVDKLYKHFAPIGSGLNRIERKVSIKEASYRKAIEGYNSALNRKKGLEMTAATIKVLSPPSFPLNTINIDRKKLGIMAFAMTFFALFGIFIIIELLDHTLRDKIRTERLSKTSVLFSFPNFANKKDRAYNNECQKIATQHLSTQILQLLKKRSTTGSYIVGISSIEEKEGKTYISELLLNYWEEIGLKVKHVNWNVDYNINSKKYMLADNLSDLVDINSDIVLFEFPAAGKYPIPSAILKECTLNLIVTRATRSWKNKDSIILEQLRVADKVISTQIILNQVDKSETEFFTGILPPYTRFNRLKYKLSNFGLTETEAVSSKQTKENIADENSNA